MQGEEEFLNNLRRDFLEEASFLIDDAEEIMLSLDKDQDKESQMAKLFRIVHTIKGSGGAVGFEVLVKMAHAFEDYLALLRVNPEKVDTAAITTESPIAIATVGPGRVFNRRNGCSTYR